MTASPPSRQASLDRLASQTFDVLVIGGGIVGACVARDAAMRGLRAGLLEKGDFASGTSGKSSRLLHGGIRYLGQGRIGLVRESSREKRTLARIAPHLAQPLAFVFPAYAGVWPPLWQLRIGVKAYDWLCGADLNFEPSRALSAAQTIERAPGLRLEGLKGAARFFDALTNDARLVIDTLRSAECAGATLANYAEATAFDRSGEVWKVAARDTLSGGSFAVAARSVVNAAGVWGARLPPSRLALRPSKGVHAVISRDRLPILDAVVMVRGPRIVFAIPWGDGVILGTTDTDYTGSLDDVRADARDIEEILGASSEYFPEARLRFEDVKSVWAGLRPLIASRRFLGGAGREPSAISREHKIAARTDGWIDVAGGKLTTSRLMAEQIVNAACAWLRAEVPPCRTARIPLLDASQAAEGWSRIEPPQIAEGFVRHCCRHEWALTVEDMLVRRAGWAYWLDDAEGAAERAAAWMADELGWPDARRQSQVRAFFLWQSANDRWRNEPIINNREHVECTKPMR